MKTKKILIFGRYIAAFGGAHKYLLRLSERLNEAGHRVWIGFNVTEDTADFASKLELSGSRVFNVPFEANFTEQCIEIIDSSIAEFEPDVIDVEVAAHVVRAPLLLSSKFNDSTAKKIFTMHLAIKSEKSPKHIVDAYFPWSAWNKSLRRLRNFVNAFDEGISVSRYHADRITRLLRLDSGFFEFIANGVDPNKFSSRQEYAQAEPVIIGGCGSLTSQKRFDVLIDALGELKKTGARFSCRIAGEGPERERLSKQIVSCDLENEVQLLGHCNDIQRFFSGLDIFVMCSDNEGFPYAQLEAMACGLPSVVTRVGDLPELVRDGTDGFVIAPGDSVGLQRALSKFLADLNWLEEYGRSARKRIETDFNAQVQELVTLRKLTDW